MAQLIGLKMQGIRSIGDDAHVIEFLHPLTIIQGPNGTGKTTTIEALNYVTTGALPSGKMQSFIHNNKLANKNRVDALVQLKFKDLKGNICTSTKRMNLSSTRMGKSTAKSDEFTLVVKNQFGEDKKISSKVADFNKEMLNLLGVPKAILEHVIFCHQEESNWPLSEPKELKIRFDAIFEVTKYVKALDNIKKNIKELEIQIRIIDAELPSLKADLESKANLTLNYDQSKKSLKKNSEKIDNFLEEKRLIEEKIFELSKDVKMADDAKRNTDMLFNEMRMKRSFINTMNVKDYPNERDQLIGDINRLENSSFEATKENDISKRELEQMVRQFETELKNLNLELNRNENLKSQRSNMLTMKQGQLEKYKKTITEVIKDASLLDSRLAEVRQVLQKSRTDVGRIDGCRLLYDKWADEILQKQCCPLCERKYDTKLEANRLVQMVKQKQENIPAESQMLSKTIRRYQEEESNLVKTQPFVNMAENVERELPEMMEDLSIANDKVEKSKILREAKEKQLVEAREKFKTVMESQMTFSQRDNDLRILKEQLRKMDLKNELKELEVKIQDLQWKGRDQQALLSENDALKAKASELNNTIQRLKGEQIQIEQKIKEINHQLKSPRFAESKQAYVKKTCERSVVAFAIEDLSKFWKILDDSIIAFHQQKMEQINQILQELWVKVYQGNDIESIKIKSQPVSGGEKKKSYDYSVVMTVDQIEIDMRDHCSAGQKVLASILIRIALADVFAGNCPVLALDEPTTNLDADKVENIGVMLKSLLEYRNDIRLGEEDCCSQADETNPLSATMASATQKTRSLQLLVITHDKRLVDHLYLACRPEFIYGLSKDENGVSRIRKHKRVCENFDC